MELVEGLGVYVDRAQLRCAEQNSKSTVTGLMRSLISLYYNSERLAGSSANKGINITIRTAVFGKHFVCVIVVATET